MSIITSVGINSFSENTLTTSVNNERKTLLNMLQCVENLNENLQTFQHQNFFSSRTPCIQAHILRIFYRPSITDFPISISSSSQIIIENLIPILKYRQCILL